MRTNKKVYRVRPQVKKKEWTKRSSIHYSKEEEDLIAHLDLSPKEIALLTGRSESAIRHKRLKLLRRQQGIDESGELYFHPYSGAEISAKRKALGLTLGDLASYCGTSPTPIMTMEKNEHKYKVLRILATLVIKDFEYEIINWEKMEEKN